MTREQFNNLKPGDLVVSCQDIPPYRSNNKVYKVVKTVISPRTKNTLLYYETDTGNNDVWGDPCSFKLIKCSNPNCKHDNCLVRLLYE
jgi:hypothetical protein